MFEEGEESVLAVALESFASDHPDDGISLDCPHGDPLQIFFISVATENIHSQVPASCNDDFVPVVPASRRSLGIAQLMAAFDSRSTAINSEAEE